MLLLADEEEKKILPAELRLPKVFAAVVPTFTRPKETQIREGENSSAVPPRVVVLLIAVMVLPWMLLATVGPTLRYIALNKFAPPEMEKVPVPLASAKPMTLPEIWKLFPKVETMTEPEVILITRISAPVVQVRGAVW